MMNEHIEKSLTKIEIIEVLIRTSSILLNIILLIFYIWLALPGIIKIPLLGLVFAPILGLAPLIVTTYFLIFLNNKKENLLGIFFVIPISFFIHYFILNQFINFKDIIFKSKNLINFNKNFINSIFEAVFSGSKSFRNFLIFGVFAMFLELIAAILVIVIHRNHKINPIEK